MTLPASPAAHPTPARYVMIGGFLGAGKTTAVARLASVLHGRGLRVGLITNDQGSGLVDTAVLRARGFATEEIPGGCFCCRFNSLVDAARKLTAANRPDVFIAEPVGSCTDLVATVTYPLRRIYGSEFSIAPLSVVVDPQRAARVLGLSEGRAFSDKVRYIYRKQLEEADIIAINKCDAVPAGEITTLRDRLQKEFPAAEIFEVSARNGDGISPWFTRLLSQTQVARKAIDIDYETYADGEARLGWLNATLALQGRTEFDANRVLETFARDVQARLATAGAEVAHLKMTFSPEGGLNDIAAINLVRSDFVPELSLRLDQPCDRGQLIVNLRGEASSDILKDAVQAAAAALATSALGVDVHVEHLEHFQPGKPQPTHRVLLTPT